MRRINALTGLRGAAALWVAAYHLLLPAAFLTGLPALILSRGYLAVDVFFVLSGFVLARTYGDAITSAASLPGFLWRRWARIFPLYGLILTARLAYTALRYHGAPLTRPWLAVPMAHPWTDIAANLALVQSWGLAPSLIGPAWSVSTEWAAYWAFPPLAWLMLRARPRLALASAVGAMLAVMAATQHGRLDAWDTQTAGPMLRCLGGFILGMGLHRLSAFVTLRHLPAHPAASWAICLALPTAFAAGLPDLVIYPLLPALILVLACGQGLPVRLLAASPAVWLGEISYALYLLHVFLLHPLDQARAAARLALPPALADTLAAGLVLAFLLAAAELAHRVIERPARSWLATLRWPGTHRRSSLTHPGRPPKNLPLPALRGPP